MKKKLTRQSLTKPGLWHSLYLWQTEQKRYLRGGVSHE